MGEAGSLPVRCTLQAKKSERELWSSVALVGHPLLFSFLGVSYVGQPS